jgi:hypothetical protein
MNNMVAWTNDSANSLAFASYLGFKSGGRSILTDQPASLAACRQALSQPDRFAPDH